MLVMLCYVHYHKVRTPVKETDSCTIEAKWFQMLLRPCMCLSSSAYSCFLLGCLVMARTCGMCGTDPPFGVLYHICIKKSDGQT